MEGNVFYQFLISVTFWYTFCPICSHGAKCTQAPLKYKSQVYVYLLSYYQASQWKKCKLNLFVTNKGIKTRLRQG